MQNISSKGHSWRKTPWNKLTWDVVSRECKCLGTLSDPLPTPRYLIYNVASHEFKCQRTSFPHPPSPKNSAPPQPAPPRNVTYEEKNARTTAVPLWFPSKETRAFSPTEPPRNYIWNGTHGEIICQIRSNKYNLKKMIRISPCLRATSR